MLRLAGLESIDQLLAGTGRLAELLSQRAPGFVQSVEQWLADLEAALTRHRLPQAAEVVAVRTGLIAARRRSAAEASETGRRPSRARLLDAAAVQALQRATELVAHALAPVRTRFGEAEEVTRRTVALARLRNVVRADVPAPVAAALLWGTLKSTPELAGGAVTLEGLVGAEDAISFLARDLAAYPPVDGADRRDDGVDWPDRIAPGRRELSRPSS